MPKVSINILTKNRAQLLEKALFSVSKQTFKDYEIIVVNDGSTDETEEILKNFKFQISNFKIIRHQESKGITQSRQEALLESSGEYIAVLDDDDEWVDSEKLAKQVKYLEENPEVVLCGGGIKKVTSYKLQVTSYRPEADTQIRKTMLLRNNFFTSTVMFRREVALQVGGFKADEDDFAEDYDLWLRLGKLGKMYNFQEPFTAYRVPNYNKARFKAFLRKQLRLIEREKQVYPLYYLARILLKLRLFLW